MKTFQSLFPSLSPNTLSLSSARRIVLVSYNAERGTIDFRHFRITVKPYGVSKRVRRVLEGSGAASAARVLDLGNEKDVADFLTRKRGEPGPGGADGYESAASSVSSAAGDDGDAVSLADDYVGRNNTKGQKRAVRLDEIGPRMELKLVKITEGVPGKEGNVIYHEFVKKSKAEAAAQKADHAAKEKLRKERREEQLRNVERKEALGKAGTTSEHDDDDEDVDGTQSEREEEEGDWDEDDEFSEGRASEGEDESDDQESETEEVQARSKRRK
ncbi:hypothetical protein EWM64_g837 [Hericium alpestre]|uniref:Brix domain-containing protein n=1 Tax=Hericium alpestre TaxID=135208 RepID=A0A4Z0A7Z2_9AGAM|nr:hypothetical protein EWM64_g837 [Hericium alpestre]